MSFSDYFDTMELVAFESTYNRYKNLLCQGKAVLINAVVKKRNEETGLSLIAVSDLDALRISADSVLYLRLSDRAMVSDIKPILDSHPGEGRVCLYFADTKERLMTDKSHGVEFTNELIRELYDALGAENVRIK